MFYPRLFSKRYSIFHILFGCYLIELCATNSDCNWPTVDALFIIDSTLNLGEENHRLILNFVRKVVEQMKLDKDESHVALTQFTPEAKYEFQFLYETMDRFSNRLNNVPYVPCKSETCEKNVASINSMAETEFNTQTGDRRAVPDVLIVVTTSLYQIPELNSGELLMKPYSPTHAFIVIIGNTAPQESGTKPLQFAATTSYMATLDFDTLDELVSPLCDSINSYLRPSAAHDVKTSSVAFGGAPCILTIVLVSAIALLILIMLCFAIYHYKSDNDRLRAQLTRERQNLQKTDEYYRTKLRERSAKEKEREKTFVEMINDSNKARDQLREEQLEQLRQQHQQREQQLQHQQSHLSNQSAPAPTQPQILPIVIPANPLQNGGGSAQRRIVDELKELREELKHRGIDAAETGRGVEHGNGDLPQNFGGRTGRSTKFGGSPNLIDSDYEYEAEPEESLNDLKIGRPSHLPIDHPARVLPPVDVLLLVDASSSIGNANYDNVKSYLRDFVNDIDIAPGRSRVAVIIFANEPQVYFGFDRYYSNRSVRGAIQKMPYLGGPTFLAKALTFAAGILYQEQNMKSVTRKHKYMPTPRHDRLQVMVVISDGASDDNYNQQATHLHEKMLVKVASVVTKSFNKEKMVPITRFDGAVFHLDQKEALSIWLWRQQRMWNQNFGGYIEREKSFISESKNPSPRKAVKK